MNTVPSADDSLNFMLMNFEENNKFSEAETKRLQSFADSYNKALEAEGKGSKQELGEADYLKLLITQLQHQDPSKPMEDKEFIAQTTQLNNLKQTQKMATLMEQFNTNFISGQNKQNALSFVGKEVEIIKEDGQSESGKVQSYNLNTGMLKVNNKYFAPEEITSVIAAREQGISVAANEVKKEHEGE
jgi:flagellar basal-body rod modification protein FlgD